MASKIQRDLLFSRNSAVWQSIFVLLYRIKGDRAAAKLTKYIVVSENFQIGKKSVQATTTNTAEPGFKVCDEKE